MQQQQARSTTVCHRFVGNFTAAKFFTSQFGDLRLDFDRTFQGEIERHPGNRLQQRLNHFREIGVFNLDGDGFAGHSFVFLGSGPL